MEDKNMSGLIQYKVNLNGKERKVVDTEALINQMQDLEDYAKQVDSRITYSECWIALRLLLKKSISVKCGVSE